MIQNIFTYIIFYWQPLSGLLIGLIALTFVGYINWYRDTKINIVHWIAKNIFQNGFRSETSADGLFMTITSLLLALGGILVVFALLYLTY